MLTIPLGVNLWTCGILKIVPTKTTPKNGTNTTLVFRQIFRPQTPNQTVHNFDLTQMSFTHSRLECCSKFTLRRPLIVLSGFFNICPPNRVWQTPLFCARARPFLLPFFKKSEIFENKSDFFKKIKSEKNLKSYENSARVFFAPAPPVRDHPRQLSHTATKCEVARVNI